MKGKLIKTDVNYILEDDKGVVITSTSLKKEGLSLSLKNCQAIERGFDLDELMIECVKNTINQETGSDIHKLSIALGFQKGFQKALELLGDKKFSQDEMIDCWETAHQAGRFEEKGIAEENWQTSENYIQLLQQTEWDVEIEMICPHPQDTYRCGIQYGCDEDGCNHPNQIYRLDDGCLILRKL